ncbi:dynein light chain roadblock-type 2 [Sphaerodactylus townsendi]|uniref:dynein light chain roadblock-type 2 n=1 Tax=Sphaerodactylus townsendi TaxID=933632 RepID=UPI00202600D3|nr:dynein light chain roadblock-type 2 [Sphaerodactylus townsendi]
MAEVEETLKRIQAHKGVIGTIVVNAEGIPIRTTLDNSTTVQYAGLLHQLTMKAKSTVRDIDPQNDLTFLRIRSKKHEIMVAPGNNSFLPKKRTAETAVPCHTVFFQRSIVHRLNAENERGTATFESSSKPPALRQSSAHMKSPQPRPIIITPTFQQYRHHTINPAEDPVPSCPAPPTTRHPPPNIPPVS